MIQEKIIDFLQVIEPLKSTLRHNWTKSGRQESAAEHTWRIAILFIMAQEYFKFEVDVIKVIKMILVHDIPELMEGDVPAFSKKKHGKVLKEILIAKEIFSKAPAPFDKEFFELFKEFEAGETMEAKVAEALEKIESQLQHVDSGSKYWHEKEKGQHMLNYPKKALKNLNDQRIFDMWKIVKEKIEEINKKEGILS